jgi:hypothetical protein
VLHDAVFLLPRGNFGACLVDVLRDRAGAFFEFRLLLTDFLLPLRIFRKSLLLSHQLILELLAFARGNFLLGRDSVHAGGYTLQILLAPRALISQIRELAGPVQKERAGFLDLLLGFAKRFLQHFAMSMLAFQHLLFSGDFGLQ